VRSHRTPARTTAKSAIVLVAALGVAVTSGAAIGHQPATAQSTCQTGTTGTACAAPGSPASRRPATLIGKPAPALSGPNLLATGTLDLAPMVTKPTAVVFWLNSCPHCQREMPKLERLATALAPDAQIISASIDAGFDGPKGYETPTAAAKSMHLTMPTILASELQADTWQIKSTPTAFILDAHGKVTAVIQLGAGDFATHVKRALAHVS